MLSLHQLRCFLATYELGSLTAAADQLGYSQPSVSEQIRNLERSVGGTLFTRVGGEWCPPPRPRRCGRTPSAPSRPRTRPRGLR